MIELDKVRARYFAEITGGNNNAPGWVALETCGDNDLADVAFDDGEIYLHPTYKDMLSAKNALRWMPYLAAVIEEHPDTDEHRRRLEVSALKRRLAELEITK